MPDDPILAKVAAALRQGVSRKRVLDALLADGYDRAAADRLIDDATVDLGDVGRSLAQGLTFGFADEIGGAIAGAVPGGQGYQETRDQIRRNQEAFKQEHGKLAGGLELAGAVAPALAGPMALALRGPMAAAGAARTVAPSLARRLAAGFGIGAGAGALQAAGESEQGGAELVQDVARGAGVGAAGGLATVPIAGALGRLGRFATRGTKRGVQAEADRRVAAALGGDEGFAAARSAIDDMERLRPGQGRLADVNQRTQRLLDDAVTADEPVQATAREALESRWAGQSKRLQDDVEEIVGHRIDAVSARDAVETELVELGERLYAPLHRRFPRILPGEPVRGAKGKFIPAGPANAIREFLDRPIVRNAYGITNAREMMVNPRAGAPSLQQVQGVIRRLRTAHKKLIDAGDPDARLYKVAADQLEKLTEAAVPGFAAANRAYAAVAINRDALEAGAKAFQLDPRRVMDDVNRIVAQAVKAGGRKAGERARDSYRLAMLDSLMQALRGKGLSRQQVRNWFGYFTNRNENQRALLKFAFGEDKRLLQMIERGTLEELFERTATVGKGSQTGQRIAGLIGLEEGSEDLVTDVLAGGVTGGPGGAVAGGLAGQARRLRNRPRRLAPQVARAMAPDLLTTGQEMRAVVDRLERLQADLARRLGMANWARRGLAGTVPRLPVQGREEADADLTFR